MDTLIGVVAAAVVVLPGFVTQELTVRGRPSPRSDGQTLVQRALFYSVVIQLIWSWDTWRIIGDLSDANWHRHLAEVVVWLLLVVVITPVLLGLVINEILRRAESGGGQLTRFHYALGGRDAREAWDCFFARLDDGAWVLIRLTGGEMFVGRYGLEARHAQSPAQHDVYFDEIWRADTAGRPIDRLALLSGMWVSADRIEAMFSMADNGSETGPASGPNSGPVPVHSSPPPPDCELPPPPSEEGEG